MNKTSKILIVFVTLMLMVSFASAGAGHGHGDSKGKGHDQEQNNGKGHDKHWRIIDDNEEHTNNNNGDSNDATNDLEQNEKDNGNIISHSKSNKCSVTMMSPMNFNNYSVGDIVPALYTWNPVNDRCNYTTTEYYPAPHEHYGSVICSPSRIFGEPQTNFWNTPKGQRILAWKANSINPNQ